VVPLEQLRADLAGLERLHALQLTLIREIRRQLETLSVRAEAGRGETAKR
jgi:hypothetical protein